MQWVTYCWQQHCLFTIHLHTQAVGFNWIDYNQFTTNPQIPMFNVKGTQGLATGHMYAYMVVCSPLQCDRVVYGSLGGKVLMQAWSQLQITYYPSRTIHWFTTQQAAVPKRITSMFVQVWQSIVAHRALYLVALSRVRDHQPCTLEWTCTQTHTYTQK